MQRTITKTETYDPSIQPTAILLGLRSNTARSESPDSFLLMTYDISSTAVLLGLRSNTARSESPDSILLMTYDISSTAVLLGLRDDSWLLSSSRLMISKSSLSLSESASLVIVGCGRITFASKLTELRTLLVTAYINTQSSATLVIVGCGRITFASKLTELRTLLVTAYINTQSVRYTHSNLQEVKYSHHCHCRSPPPWLSSAPASTHNLSDIHTQIYRKLNIVIIVTVGVRLPGYRRLKLTELRTLLVTAYINTQSVRYTHSNLQEVKYSHHCHCRSPPPWLSSAPASTHNLSDIHTQIYRKLNIVIIVTVGVRLPAEHVTGHSLHQHTICHEIHTQIYRKLNIVIIVTVGVCLPGYRRLRLTELRTLLVTAYINTQSVRYTHSNLQEVKYSHHCHCRSPPPWLSSAVAASHSPAD
ncbi:hypothetical protein J6590_059612 [Homalodisca vitripennis]|nr:hypothetical protein J6590_059612 [Homalodisca vitripennis]